MVVIFSKEGQLANRLWNAAHIIANALENGHKVAHLYFDDYATFFSKQLDAKSNFIYIVGRSQRWQLFAFQKPAIGFRKVFLKLNIQKLPFIEFIHYNGYAYEDPPFDLSRPDFLEKVKKKMVLISGWRFEDMKSLEKHKTQILSLFTPNEEYVTPINRKVDLYRKSYDILVGIHIRMGDYKKFNNGVWCYTIEQYISKMQEMAMLDVFANKKIAFIVCSNEVGLRFPCGKNFEIIYEQRHFVQDLYLLSKCDYILGPPSTFSLWASFYGSVPLLQLSSINSNIRLEDFQCYH